MRKFLTDEQKEAILDLHNKGFSIRHIAREILGRTSKNTTVHDFLKRIGKTGKKQEVKILLLDIETSPAIAYHWKRYDENIGQAQVIQDPFILTYSAKWLESDKMMFGNLSHKEVLKRDDSRICKELKDLLDKAHIIIAHNGLSFDVKVINTRLIYNGFKIPLPYKVIDTYKIVKAVFKFPSNGLENVCIYLGIGEKVNHDGFSLWRGYMEGDEESIAHMIKYNEQDVILLEKLYLKVRSWDKRHPNLTVYNDDKNTCSCCSSSRIEETDETVFTNVSGFYVYKCLDCGKYMRSRTNILKGDDKVLIVNNSY